MLSWKDVLKPDFFSSVATLPKEDDILNFVTTEKDRFQICEDHYDGTAEPWNYSDRAMELLRHEWLIEHVKETGIHASTNILEMGCSQGLMTEKLASLGSHVVSMDLSPKAVTQAKRRCGNYSNVKFLVADACKLPFQDNSFDRVTLCDGLFAWHIDENAQIEVSKEVTRVLKPGGVAFFSDYIHHKAFYKVRANAVAGGLVTQEEHLLGDRLGYQFASAFKAIDGLMPVKKLLGNKSFGRVLLHAGKLLGEAGSRHILVIAKKQ